MKKVTNLLFIAVSIALYSCGGGGSQNISSLTGWEYNNSDWGGFEVVDYFGQETGPGLVLIEGGTYTMGMVEQDLMYEYNLIPKRITVPSFYLDMAEVANVHYREYIYWLMRTFGADYPEIITNARPDTLVWREELAYNDPYVEYYFRHPAYNYYPVVGVNWLQAADFCKWRTDRVNEFILIRDGFLELNPNQINEDNFNTGAYLVGQYEGMVKSYKLDYNPMGTGERRLIFEDGYLMPDYRLPTEAEWEYAATALIGNNEFEGEELITHRRIYPWNGHGLRNAIHGSWQGGFLANFKRGRGDNMGVAGGLNDNADITAPIYSFMPNDYGLYNMAGNVSEWTADVYRPLSPEDMEDFNPYRGNVFMKIKMEDGTFAQKDSMGRMRYEKVTDEDIVSQNRRNYFKADNIDYLDGDERSQISYSYGVSTLVSNKARVYKGGSWDDRAYYLTPAQKRFMDEGAASATIGFRCAMMRVGSPAGNAFEAGNNFAK